MDLLPLQGWMRQRLGANAVLRSLTGNRIYDRVPDKAKYPYVSFGPVEATQWADLGCLDGWEVFPQIDCWSQEVGYPECKKIVDGVLDALGERQPIGFVNKFVVWELRAARVLRDPDGLTSHGIVTFRTVYVPYV